jgi:hypothetical protein
MAGETQAPASTGEAKTKVKRTRKASTFLLMKQNLRNKEVVGPTGEPEEVDVFTYTIVAEGKSYKACEKVARDKQVTGELMILCVHGKITAAVQQVHTFTKVK